MGAGKEDEDSHEAVRVKKLKINEDTKAVPRVRLARSDFLSTKCQFFLVLILVSDVL